MKICVYDWALHSLGGGQKFDCKIAEHFSKNHDVTLLSLFPIDKKKLEKIYSLDLSKVETQHLYKKGNPAILHLLSYRKVSKISKDFDLFLNADAHETVFPKAKHNILYCHFFEPKKYRKPHGIKDLLWLTFNAYIKTIAGNHAKKYQVYCNSKYTAKWLKKLWNIQADVIYPPIKIPTIKKIKKAKKENLILSVGRLTRDKNYEFAIECFKDLYNKGIKNYKLIIIAAKSDDEYYEELKTLSKGFPIEFLLDQTEDQLSKIYSKAKFLIHAKGLGINEEEFPGLLEHFGMVLAEAMTHNCIPIAFNGGGPLEIIDEEKNGYRFNNKKEAVQKILKTIKNPTLAKKLAKAAREKSKLYSLQRLHKDLNKMLASVTYPESASQKENSE